MMFSVNTRELFFRILKILLKVCLFLLFAMVLYVVFTGKNTVNVEVDTRDKFSVSVKVVDRYEEFSDRIKRLSEIEKSLDDLKQFVENQRRTISEMNKYVEDLKGEKQNIEEFLNLNEDQVASLLDAYHQRINVWVERGWGFISGVLASIIGSFALLVLIKEKK